MKVTSTSSASWWPTPAHTTTPTTVSGCTWRSTPAEARMRILEGRRRQVEERREGLREAVARASSSFDRYTRQLHQLGLESSPVGDRRAHVTEAGIDQG